MTESVEFTLEKDIFSIIKQEQYKELKTFVRRNYNSLENRNKEEHTPLLYAACLGFEPIIALLLQLGADLNAADNSGNTALHIAAEGGYPSCISTLISAGANIDAFNYAMKSPLSIVALRGHTLCVALLLAAGASTTSLPNTNQANPIHHALLGGHVDALTILASAGTPINALDKDFYSPLHLAATLPSIDVTNPTSNSELPVVPSPLLSCVEALLKFGAQVNLACGSGKSKNTPLHIAAKFGNEKMVEVLVAAKANINARNSPDGQTPLHIAAITSQYPCMLTLLMLGANPWIKDEYDFQPLEYLDDLQVRNSILALIEDLQASKTTQ